MNGPPNVDPKSRSAPGPIPRKNGMYSRRMTRRIPPAMQKAFFHHALKKPLAPGSALWMARIWAKILLLFSRKKTANTGM